MSEEKQSYNTEAEELIIEEENFRKNKIVPLLDILSENVEKSKKLDIRDIYLDAITVGIGRILMSPSITDDFRLELLIQRNALFREYEINLKKRIKMNTKLGETIKGEKVN